MRKIPVGRLKPGMVVGRAVFSAKGQILLAANTHLTEGNIINLEKWRIPSIYINDGLMDDIEGEPLISEETQIRTVQMVKEVLDEAAVKGDDFSFDGFSLRNQVESIIDEMARRGALVNLEDIRSINEYTYHHSVGVCLMSLVIGATLGFNQKELMNLGIGALLHDIGKTLVPGEILDKPGELTAQEFAEVLKHAKWGYDILRRQPGIGLLPAHVAFQHHERQDGTGYPRGLSGDGIHRFAQVAAVADVFDALTSDRTYRKAYRPDAALKFMVKQKHKFNPEAVEALLKRVAPYPLGTPVRLSSGEVGLVVDVPKESVDRPTVRIFTYPTGGRLPRPLEIALRSSRTIQITEVLSEDEFSSMIYNP